MKYRVLNIYTSAFSFIRFEQKNKGPENEIVLNGISQKSCRIEFGWGFSKVDKIIGIIYPEKNGNSLERIRDFFNFIENKIGLDKNKRTRIYESDNSYNPYTVIIFNLSPFWLKNDTVRAFLTIFIKCAVDYVDSLKTKNDILLTNRYAKRIPYAVERFLSGYTKPTYQEITGKDHDGYAGLVGEFKDLTNEQVDAKLVKP